MCSASAFRSAAFPLRRNMSLNRPAGRQSDRQVRTKAVALAMPDMSSTRSWTAARILPGLLVLTRSLLAVV